MWHCCNRFTNITSLHTRSKLSSHTPCKFGSRGSELVLPASTVWSPPLRPMLLWAIWSPSTLAWGGTLQNTCSIAGFFWSYQICFLDRPASVSHLQLLFGPTSLLASQVLVSSQQTSILASTTLFPAHLLWPQKCPNSCHIDSKPMISSPSPPFTRQWITFLSPLSIAGLKFSSWLVSSKIQTTT